MPSDAKILREQGPEALHAYWRAKGRRYFRAKNPWGLQCVDCGVGLPNRGLRCQPCKAENERIRHRKEYPFAPRQCEQCGTQTDGGRFNQRRYCPDCRKDRDNAASAVAARRRWSQMSPEERQARYPAYSIGAARPIRFASCQFCRTLIALSGTATLCPKPKCRVLQNRIRAREYMRRTHYMSAKYWRIADTPAAKELAYLYFTLRQELRGSTRGR